MNGRDGKVIGYFAYLSPSEVICADGDACVVSGSRRGMVRYLREVSPNQAPEATVKRTRFGEILRGLELGGAYAFDPVSYSRFYPLALEAGLPVQPADFEGEGRAGNRFLTVRLVTR